MRYYINAEHAEKYERNMKYKKKYCSWVGYCCKDNLQTQAPKTVKITRAILNEQFAAWRKRYKARTEIQMRNIPTTNNNENRYYCMYETIEFAFTSISPKGTRGKSGIVNSECVLLTGWKKKREGWEMKSNGATKLLAPQRYGENGTRHIYDTCTTRQGITFRLSLSISGYRMDIVQKLRRIDRRGN